MKRFQSISENLSYNDILQLDGAFSALHINYGKSPLFNGENSKDLAKNSRKNSVSSLEHVEDVFEYMTHFNGVENDFKKADRIVLWEKYWLEYTNAFEHLTEVLPIWEGKQLNLVLSIYYCEKMCQTKNFELTT